MSTAATAPAAPPITPAAPSGGVTLFGRRISYDALLLAGATLLGVFFAYNLSKSGAGLNLGVPADAGAAAANPSLPATSSSLNIAPDPSGSAGGAPTTTLGSPATSSSTGTPRPTSGGGGGHQSGALGGLAAAVRRGGLIGSGGGPNTTGRSSGTQIYDPTPTTVLPNVPPRVISTGGRGGPRMVE